MKVLSKTVVIYRFIKLHFTNGSAWHRQSTLSHNKCLTLSKEVPFCVVRPKIFTALWLYAISVGDSSSHKGTNFAWNCLHLVQLWYQLLKLLWADLPNPCMKYVEAVWRVSGQSPPGTMPVSRNSSICCIGSTESFKRHNYICRRVAAHNTQHFINRNFAVLCSRLQAKLTSTIEYHTEARLWIETINEKSVCNCVIKQTITTVVGKPMQNCAELV